MSGKKIRKNTGKTPGKQRSRGNNRGGNILRTLFPIGVTILAFILASSLGLFGVLLKIIYMAISVGIIYVLMATLVFKKPFEDVMETIKNIIFRTGNKTKDVMGKAYKGTQKFYDNYFEGYDEYEDELEEYNIQLNNDNPFDDGEDEEDELDLEGFDFGQDVEDYDDIGDVEVKSHQSKIAQGTNLLVGDGEPVKVSQNTDKLDVKNPVDYFYQNDRLIESHQSNPIDWNAMTTVAIGENTELDVYGGNIIIEGNEKEGLSIFTDTSPGSFNQPPTILKVQGIGKTIEIRLYGISRVQFRNVKVKANSPIISRTTPNIDDGAFKHFESPAQETAEDLEWKYSMDDSFESDIVFGDSSLIEEGNVSESDIDELLKHLQ